MKTVFALIMCVALSFSLHADGKDKQKKEKPVKKRIMITMECDDEGNIIHTDSTEIEMNVEMHGLKHLHGCTGNDSARKIIIKKFGDKGCKKVDMKKCIKILRNDSICKDLKDFHFSFDDDFENVFHKDFSKDLKKEMKKLEKKMEGMEGMLQKLDSLQFQILESLQGIHEEE